VLLGTGMRTPTRECTDALWQFCEDGDKNFQGGSDPEAAAKVPLALSAMFVISFEAVELITPIYAMHAHGWHKAFIASVLLKSIVFSLVLFMAEGVLKCAYFDKLGILGKPVDIFVHANRLAKDIFTASFIFCTLSIGVLLNTINDALCPAFNLHQLLIYRARPLRPDLACRRVQGQIKGSSL